MVNAATYEIPQMKIRMVRDGAPIKCSTPDVAAEVLRQICCEDPVTETMAVVMLDGRAQVRSATVVAQGGRNSVVVTVAEIFRPALIAGAHAIVLGHNHPSGSATPSAADDAMTAKVKEAGELLGIPLVDHIIVTENANETYSYMADERLTENANETYSYMADERL